MAPDADALVDTTECLKDAESSIFNEVGPAGHEEEITIQHLMEGGRRRRRGRRESGNQVYPT